MPSKLEILRQLALRQKGAYGAQRVERAADEIKNLTKLYSPKALDAAFLGDNAKALMTMNPKDFERYAAPLVSRTPTDIGKTDPNIVKRYGPKMGMTTEDYLKELQQVQGGFADVPYLEINKGEQGSTMMPYISGHEGRHRNRAMAASGEQAGLIRLEPRAELREPFPRRSQEEYIEALRQELGMTGNKVVPQGGYEGIDLPPIYKQGGEVSQDAMRMAVMNQKVQHKAIGGVPNPIGVKKTVMKIFGRDVPIVSNDKASINKAIASGMDPRDIAYQFRNRDKENQEQNLRMLNKILGQSPEARVMIPQKNLGSSGLKESQPYEVPPPLPRAKNMPKKELLARAQGVAAQRNNEFVRDPLRTEESKDTTGRSKKEFLRQQTLQHDIRPKFNDGITPATVDYSKHKDDVLIGIKGDPTPTDVMIHRVNDTQLTDPVESEGGPLYALRKAMKAWASNYTAASGVQNLVNTASQQYGGRGVLGQYIKMGPDSYSYAQHFADTALNMFDPSKYTPQQIDAINNFFRQGYLKKGERIAFPEFAGIENPTLASLQMQADPNLRKFFGDTLQIPKQANALGLPSGKDIAHALTEPDLRNLETGITGESVMQMEPGVFILQPSSSKTYDTDIGRKANTPLMQSEVPMPYDLTFPDTVAQIRANPEQRGALEFGSLGMVGARQIMDPQWQDQINTYTDYIKRYTGKKKGGAVHMAGGSLVDDLISDAKKKQSAPVDPLVSKASTKPSFSQYFNNQKSIESMRAEVEANRLAAEELTGTDRIPDATVRSTEPAYKTPRERYITPSIEGSMTAAGMNPNLSRRETETINSGVDWVPGAMFFEDARNVGDAVREGRYLDAYGNSLMGAANLLGAGVVAKKVLSPIVKPLANEAAFRIHQAMTTGEGSLAPFLSSIVPKNIAPVAKGGKKTTFEMQNELAQKRAMLPKDQYGLELPAGNTAAQRLAAMGFDTPAYHSTKQDPAVLLPRPPAKSRRGSDFGVHVGVNPETANGAIIPQWYERNMRDQATRADLPASIRGESLKDIKNYYENSQVMPLLVNAGKSLEMPDLGRWDSPNNMMHNIASDSGVWPNYVLKKGVKTNDPDALDELIKSEVQASAKKLFSEERDELHKKAIEDILKKKGYGSIAYPNTVEGSGDISLMFTDPDRIRSRFAAGDPFRRNAAIAAAMGVAAPDLLAAENKAEGGEVTSDDLILEERPL